MIKLMDFGKMLQQKLGGAPGMPPQGGAPTMPPPMGGDNEAPEMILIKQMSMKVDKILQLVSQDASEDKTEDSGGENAPALP